MKLIDILLPESERGVGYEWHTSLANATNRPTGASAARGWWLLSRQGKRLAGPFADEEKANRFKTNRPDRIPSDAVAKKL